MDAHGASLAGIRAEDVFRRFTLLLLQQCDVREATLAVVRPDGGWRLLFGGPLGRGVIPRPSSWPRSRAPDCPWRRAFEKVETSIGNCGGRNHCDLSYHEANGCVCAPVTVGGEVRALLGCPMPPAPRDASAEAGGGAGVGPGDLVPGLVRAFADLIAQVAFDYDGDGGGGSESFASAGPAIERSRGPLLARALEVACGIGRADYGGIALMDEALGTLRLVAARGFDGDVTGTEIPVAGSLSGRAVRTGLPVVASGAEVRDLAGALYGQGSRMAHSLHVPIRLGDRTTGTLNLGISADRGGNPFPAERIDRLRTFAQLVSALIERDRLASEQLHTAELQRRLLEVSRTASGQRVSANLQLLLDELAGLVEADYGMYASVSDEGAALRVAASTPGLEDVVGLQFPARETFAGEAVNAGMATIIPAVEIRGRIRPEFAQVFERRGGIPEEILFVPVFMGGNVHGVAGLVYRSGSERRFTWQQAIALQVLSHQLSVFLENSGLIDLLERRNRSLSLLFRETHHRIKNGLQMISSMLEIEQGRLTDPLATDALARVRGRVASMGRAYEMLSSDIDERVPVQELVRRVLAGAVVRRGTDDEAQVEIEQRGEQCGVRPRHVVPLALAVHEMGTNAAKHGAPRRIVVRITGGDGTCELDWRNDGVSGAGDVRPRLGLRLVEALVWHDMGGECEFERGDGEFHARFRFPCGDPGTVDPVDEGAG